MVARRSKPERGGSSAPAPVPAGVDDGLATYRAKRSADQTGEPFGSARPLPAPNAPRLFVVQMHAARRLHYDLRLEIHGALRSWAVPRGFSLDPAVKRLAVLTEDHPLEYVHFEGIIPAGNYGAGGMIVWDRGTWIPLEPVEAGFAEGKLLFELRGQKLRGIWTLVRTKEAGGKHWLLLKKPDAVATPGHDGAFDPSSVLSGLTVDELERATERAAALGREVAGLGAPPLGFHFETFEPMLAEADTRAFDDPDWVFELKYDGYRVLAERTESRVRLRYRSRRDANATFPELVEAVGRLPYSRFVLDGEAVVLDEDGRPNFSRLAERGALQRPLDIDRAMREHPVTLYAFDLLALDDRDLRDLPLLERKRLLRALLPTSGIVRYSDHIVGQGRRLMQEVSRLGVEGVVAKRSDSRYVAGRSPQWKKIRIEHTTDLAVAGYRKPNGSRVGFGALHLAACDEGRWVYVGRVGSGFRDEDLQSIRERLDALPPPSTALENRPRGQAHVWVEPRLVVEVKYKNVTPDRALRAPVFLRVRDDKAPESCSRPAVHGHEEPGPAPLAVAPAPEPQPAKGPEPPRATRDRVTVTNPEKLFWPDEGYTKGDLVAYYREVSPWLLPYLRDRPLVLTRYPDGVAGKSFFQKNAPPHVPPWLRTHIMWNEEARREVEYFVCDDEDALVYVANMASIPLHVRAARMSDLQHPDWCILDLDPKGAPFREVVRIARFIHELCEEIGLPNFCKTSGSTGLHVLVPLGGAFTHAQSKMFAEVLARVVEQHLRDVATLERHVPKRKGKVYLDYLQNGHGRLLVSPLCVRPRPGATVSTPLRWDEVTEHLDASLFTIRTVPARLRASGDPMAPLLEARPQLPAVLEQLLARLA